MDLQPFLQSEIVQLIPLRNEDLEKLYAVASDPLVWEQHPNKERYKREVFENYFEGAMQSGGAFLIKERLSGEVIGSSRYYDLDKERKEITIGYTFLGRKWWGGKFNPEIKRLMLEHAFKHVDTVYFHIGAVNVRSQKAMERLGGKKVGEEMREYYGEKTNLNFIYCIKKESWERSSGG